MLRLVLAALKATLSFLYFLLFLSSHCPLHKYCRLTDGHRKNSETIGVEKVKQYGIKVCVFIFIYIYFLGV